MARKRTKNEDMFAGQSLRSIAGLPDPGTVVKVCGPGGVPLDALGNPIPQQDENSYEIETGDDYDFSVRGLEDKSLDYRTGANPEADPDSPFVRRRGGETSDMEFAYSDEDLLPETDRGYIESGDWYEGTGYPDDIGATVDIDDHGDYGEYDEYGEYGSDTYAGLDDEQIDAIYETLSTPAESRNPTRVISAFADRNGYAALGDLFYDGVLDGEIAMGPELRKHLNFIYALTKTNVRPASEYLM